ncbi:hypothetical protein [Rhizobium sp. BK176]|uniref:hypothetical protein n=1 Tax=Rhizobium sp. BK176 TaxID=2587071 RepID=UPI0021673AE6|nr:hypothetical protein [Rhizobium sp. BK176]MCS4088511.1 hypothetical protein [Rhizobium sp. BK176]
MILERPYVMPYAYLVDAVVRRKRSTIGQKFARTGHVEGMVKEVSLVDAPVVLSWSVNAGPDALRHEVRFFDGKFYLPAMSAHDSFPANYRSEVFEKGDLPNRAGMKTSMSVKLHTLSQARLGTPLAIEEARALGTVLKEGFFIPAVLESQVESIVASTEEDRRSAATKLLQDCLVVKRDLWIRIEEPRFMLRREDPIPGGEGETFNPFAEVYFGPSDVSDCIFPLARRHVGSPWLTTFFSPTELQAFAEEAASRNVVYAFRNVVVHDPSVFTSDWDLNARVRLVDFAVSSMAPEMGTQSRSVFAAFLEARDAGIRFRETGDRSLIDEALTTHVPLLAEEFEGKKDEVISEIIESLSQLGSEKAPSTSASQGLSL